MFRKNDKRTYVSFGQRDSGTATSNGRTQRESRWTAGTGMCIPAARRERQNGC